MCSIGKGKPMIGFRYVSLPSLCCLPNKMHLGTTEDVCFGWCGLLQSALTVCVFCNQIGHRQEKRVHVCSVSRAGGCQRGTPRSTQTQVLLNFMLLFLFSHTATRGATSHLTYLIIMYGGIHQWEREREAQIGETLIILWKKALWGGVP